MPEPLVVAADVRRVLRAVVRPEDPDFGDAVSELAHRAGRSRRTVYRVLGGQSETLSLDLADRLVLAAGRQLSEIGCHVVLADGRVVDWEDA